MRSALAAAAAITRLHIVAIAALGALTFGWLFTGRYLWLATGLTALDWFFVNLLNRTVDLREDAENGIAGTDWVARFRRPLFGGALALLSVSFILGLWLPLSLSLLRVGYHLLGACYNWRLLPGRRRLKDLYFIKNTASALGFVLTVFGYPLALTGWNAALFPAGISWWTVLFCLGWFTLFEISYEILYDLRDAPGDAKAGVRTYPVVHGERIAARIIDALLVIAMLLLVGGYALTFLPWRIFAMILAPAAQLVLYRHALRRGISSAFCVGLTWLGAGLLTAYHLWILARLPGIGLP